MFFRSSGSELQTARELAGAKRLDYSGKRRGERGEK
jgi:hypothetical protein